MAVSHVAQSLAQGTRGWVPASTAATLLLTIPSNGKGHEAGAGGPGLPSQRAVSPPAWILLPPDRPSLSSNSKSRHDM